MYVNTFRVDGLLFSFFFFFFFEERRKTVNLSPLRKMLKIKILQTRPSLFYYVFCERRTLDDKWVRSEKHFARATGIRLVSRSLLVYCGDRLAQFQILP